MQRQGPIRDGNFSVITYIEVNRQGSKPLRVSGR